MQRDFAPPRVDGDFIAILYQGQKPAERGFRRQVSHNETMTAAREPPVRDERDFIAQSLAHDGAGRT